MAFNYWLYKFLLFSVWGVKTKTQLLLAGLKKKTEKEVMSGEAHKLVHKTQKKVQLVSSKSFSLKPNSQMNLSLSYVIVAL